MFRVSVSCRELCCAVSHVASCALLNLLSCTWRYCCAHDGALCKPSCSPFQGLSYRGPLVRILDDA